MHNLLVNSNTTFWISFGNEYTRKQLHKNCFDNASVVTSIETPIFVSDNKSLVIQYVSIVFNFPMLVDVTPLLLSL